MGGWRSGNCAAVRGPTRSNVQFPTCPSWFICRICLPAAELPRVRSSTARVVRRCLPSTRDAAGEQFPSWRCARLHNSWPHTRLVVVCRRTRQHGVGFPSQHMTTHATAAATMTAVAVASAAPPTGIVGAPALPAAAAGQMAPPASGRGRGGRHGGGGRGGGRGRGRRQGGGDGRGSERRAGRGGAAGGKRDRGGGAIRAPKSLVELIPPKYRGAMLVGNSPEEIERWRAERRKHFPTAQNIKLKQEQEEARRQKGALAAASSSSRIGGTPRTGRAGQGSPAKRPRTEAKRPNASNASGSAGGAAQAAVVRVSDEALGCSDDEAPEEVPTGSSALAGLAAYASDSDGDEASAAAIASAATSAAAGTSGSAAAPERAAGGAGGASDETEAVASDTRLGVVADGGSQRDTRKGRPCRFFLNGSCHHGDRCKYVHNEEARAARAVEQLKRRREGEARRREAPTLLKKLLAHDIERENSAALQVIRYIVQTNFLESADGAGSETA